ncbi:MAG TPA: DUF3592 domain-containing protein [Terriglobia bacterium]|nr:DUF3592 domain-containing protein [Terriglobia bacterium]
MDSRSQILIAGAFALVGLGAAAWGWRRLARWRQKDPKEVERLRRLDVNRRGRITTAEIVDLFEPDASGETAPSARPVMVIYKYQVAGVTYEVSQDVSTLPAALSASRSLASQTASIKYDPKAPTNSIIACEAWNGMEPPSDGARNSR